MNRRHFLTTLSVLGLGAAALTARATLARRQSSARPPRIVTTKTSAYLIGKVEPVLSGKIQEVAPAPQGRYVLVVQNLRPEPESGPSPTVRLPPFGEQKLWLYDALRRTTKLIHRVQDSAATQTWQELMSLAWFSETKRALVTVATMRRPGEETQELQTELGIFDVERGTIRWLSGLPSESITTNELPALSGLLLSWKIEKASAPKTRVFTVLRSDGSLSPAARVPYEKSMPFARGVSPDGKRLFVCATSFERVETRFLAREKWEVVELASGAVTPLKEAPKPEELVKNTLGPKPKSKPLDLTLQSDAAKLTGSKGRSAETTALWLEASEPGPEKKFVRGLVTAEGGAAYLLADLSAVLYTHDDSLYAAPIASLDRVAFEKLQRELTMSRAKQVGLSMMMYAQDYDENLPHDPANVAEAVMPYLKDAETLAGFVYTYKGTTAFSKIETPATTVLGHIPGPGGRAVVYADGHVRWELTP